MFETLIHSLKYIQVKLKSFHVSTIKKWQLAQLNFRRKYFAGGSLAKKLNFSAKKISAEEAEDIGLYYSIKEGLEYWLMVEEEKNKFLTSLEDDK